jgi:DNA-directed RNA polymerase subunit RPC12/RpoP
LARAPLDCPGSWLPVQHLQPGDKVACPVCGRKVFLSVPPMAETHDPWAGSKDARVQVHRVVSKPRPQ